MLPRPREATPDQPGPDIVKQPARPRLRDIMGPGLITGASDGLPLAQVVEVGLEVEV